MASLKGLRKINIIRTIISSIKTKKRIVVCRGGKVQFSKQFSVNGDGTIFFNSSQYRDCFNKKGHLWLGPNSNLTIKNGKVFFFSGCKIDLHPNCFLEIGGGTMFNENSRLGCKGRITIGQNCIFGDEVSIHDFDGHMINGTESVKPITIGNNVWIGEKVIILKGVTIENNVIVGAGSVVTRNLQSGYIYCGNPAKPIKAFNDWHI